jgi:alpha-2-macroglobulin
VKSPIRSICQVLKPWRFALLALLIVIAIAIGHHLQIEPSFSATPATSVAPTPNPELPNWIEQISPTGKAEPLAQIRIRFKDPLIPLEQLESSNQQRLLQQFELSPALPGQFRFLTPRMVGFQADQALPNATQFKVTLKAGLADLKQHQLSRDLTWTFQTELIQLLSLPGSLEENSSVELYPIDLRPELEITANTELLLSSLTQSASLLSQHGQQRIALRAVLKSPPPDPPDPLKYILPNEAFTMGQQWRYILTPKKKLAPNTQYQLEISAGLQSARGNLISEKTFKSYIKTYGPLAYQKLTFDTGPYEGSTYGRFVKGSPLLHFNNKLEVDSIAANLSILPAPLKVEPMFRMVGDRIISLNPWIFEPDKTYTLMLGANLKDQYGETLSKSVTIPYQPGNVASDLQVPMGFRIFPMGTKRPLNFSAVNLPDNNYQASYRVVQPKDLINVDANGFSSNGGSFFLPKPETWEHFKLPNPKLNQTQELAIPLQEKLGDTPGLLAYGITAHTDRHLEKNQKKRRDSTQYGLVQSTNLGIFAQRFPKSGFVRVHHLSDGSAVQAATIEVYPSFTNTNSSDQKRQKVDRPCATGITDQTGTFTLDPEVLKQCLQGRDRSQGQQPDVLVIARKKQDWAFVHLGDGGWRYGVSWYGSDVESRSTIFSDRGLYQPGETVWLTGAAYSLRQGVLQQDKQVPYHLTLFSPRWQKRDLGYQTTNEFGMFAVKVDLSPDQELGYYRLQATSPTGVEIIGEFRVADFKPPNFKANLSLDQPLSTPNKAVTAAVQSQYLFGNPVSGGKADFSILRQPITFTPKGWEQFSFGQQWFGPEVKPYVNGIVRNASTILDAQGQGTQIVEIADDLPYPMSYQVYVAVKDSANTEVTDSKTFTALPSDRLIGLQNDFRADAGKPSSVKMIVTDPSGQAIVGERVKIELQKMEYETKLLPEEQIPKNGVTYTTVAKTELTSAISPQAVQLIAPNAGTYRIHANFTTAQNERTATDQQIWVTGSEIASWGSPNGDHQHEIQLNQATYQPGDTATVILQSPYPEAKLYLSVVRHKVLYQSTMTVQGNVPQVQFPITAEMLPNATVQTVLVRQGTPLSQVKPGKLKDLVSIGLAPFDLSLKEKTLNVAIAPAQSTVAPKATQTVDLTLQDAQSKPVSGQLTVMVVNEAVLQLTNYHAPNLVDTVYAHRSVLTRFKDSRSDVVLESWEPVKPWVNGMPPPEPVKGLDGGPGVLPFTPGADASLIRRNFKALAYYNSSLLTDSQGRARISFTVPDDLTTWRIMAVATDRDFRFGTSDTTFLAAKPLMANPVLPQFARPGDRFAAGLSVTPSPNPQGTLTVEGRLSGAATFTSPATLQTSVSTATQTYRFPIVALQPGTAEVQFSARLGGHTDTFAVPLAVKPHAVIEQVVETGTTTAQAKIPLNLGETVEPNVGGLEMSLSSTLIPALTAPAKQVLEQEQLPFLEPAASQLAIAAHLKTLSRQYPQSFTDFDPDAQAKIALKQLQALQTNDGGFSAQPGQEGLHPKSDPLLSPYAVQSLVLAEKAGIPVNPQMLNDAKSYLNRLLVAPVLDDLCKTSLCTAKIRLQVLLALADLDDLRPNAIAKIYALRDQLDVATQLKLAGYLSRLPNRQTEAAALAEQLQEILTQTGQSAILNLPQNQEWFSSLTVAQAEMLRLQIARQAAAELQDRTLRGLLSLRREGTWGSTYDNAQALSALVAYSNQQPVPPNFQAIAQLADKTLLSQTFTGYQQTSVNKIIPMQELPRGRHDLVLQKSGEGILHYLTAYRYQPQGTQPGRLNGLRVTRTLRPVHQDAKMQRIGLTPIPQTITLNAGEVFEIEVEMITDHPVNHVLITDPLPAGLEAVDTTFQTNSAYFQARGSSWQLNYQKIHKDRIVAYSDRLDAGVYVMNYLVRAVTPGVFQWPGVEARLQYTPEEFGRSSSAMLQVKT